MQKIIIAVKDVTMQLQKTSPLAISGTLTSAILRSALTSRVTEPTGSWSLNLAHNMPQENKDEMMNTAISRKVVGKNVHATTPKGNMGYDQYTVPNDCSCRN